MYIEQKWITMGKLRQLCVDHDLYTCGTIEEYDRLLNSTLNGSGLPKYRHLTTYLLERMATDIVTHSDKGYSIPCVMSLISEYSSSNYIEV